MKFGSVCSGIEAASVAWHPLGWESAWLSEIEPFPCAVLKHHYPKVPNLGDMTKFKEWQIESNIDVLVGGTPCQSFSVAGLRKGLDDPRGNLMLTYLAIAKQHRPRWLVWENVPGVLSSADGRDFGSFLGGLAICGYGFAYRVLDAQYFGVAQRRKRVFVVGYLGDWRPAAAVLFERASLQGHPAPRRETGKVTPTISSSGTGVSRVGFNCEDEWFIETQVVGALDTECGGNKMNHQTINSGHLLPISSFYESSLAQYREDNVSGTIKASGGVAGGGSETFLAQPIAFTTEQTPKFNDNQALTLTKSESKHNQCVAQPIPIHDQATRHAGKNGEKTMGKGNGLGIGQPGEPMNTLTKGDRHAVAHPITFSSVLSNQSLNPKLEVSQTLEAKNPMAVCLGSQHPNAGIGIEQSPTLTNAMGAGGGHVPMVSQPMAYNIAPGKGELKDDIHVTDAHISKTIDASGSNPAMHQGGAAIVQIMAVRRLTPVECERLQGFPDNYTDIKPKGKPTADGPRYKALGNSMAVPVMAWIGKRIQEVENIK